MVLGKILGGTVLAMIQGVLFLLLAFTLNIQLNAMMFAEALGVMRHSAAHVMARAVMRLPVDGEWDESVVKARS